MKAARKTLTIKLDGIWNSLHLASNTPALSLAGSVLAASARIDLLAQIRRHCLFDVVRAFAKRVKLFSIMDALETCTPLHHKLHLFGACQTQK